MPKRALLIINQKSRSGVADINPTVERLKQHGIDVLERRLERPEDIPDTILRHRGEVDCVIVGGGDGSMNAAVQVLIDAGLPLGVLPMGTANDLARTLKIPSDLEQAADIIGAGLLHAIDLGCVNGHYFLNVANIGLGVHVAQHMSADMKQRWGVLSYARSLIKAISSFRPFHANIVCDGRRRRMRSMQVAVGNGLYYGGGMAVAEDASIDDHQLFLYSIAPFGWWELIRFAPAFRAGRFEKHHPVMVEQGRRIEIATRKPMTVTADGEIVARTPAHFDVKPGAIKVFVPAVYLNDRKQELLDVAQR